MTATWLRYVTWERAVVALGTAVILLSVIAGADHVPGLVETRPVLVAAYLVTLAAGELARVRLPSGRITAPVATASIMGLAFTSLLKGQGPVTARVATVVLIAAVGSGCGLLIRWATGWRLGLYQAMARLVGAVVVAALARTTAFGGVTLWQWQVTSAHDHALVALTMIAIATVGTLIEIGLTGLVRAQRRHTSWVTVLGDDLREAPALNVALISAGVLIAFLSPVLGLLSLPLALFPMILTYVAVRRYAANQETYRQMIATLSRLTEAGGYTLPDHGTRVAELSVAMARALGLPQREIQVLEYAALLHDLGQIALREPIPGGATVLAAPSDQHRIAADGARIVRHAGVLDGAAALIEVHATPYRQVRELSEEVPITSRIIKVANAYDDLTAGRRGSDAEARALERIHLGLGYEYDPAVVDALERVLRAPVLHSSRAERSSGSIRPAEA